LKVTMMDAALNMQSQYPSYAFALDCEDGSCSCKTGRNCDSKGKHPLYTGWYNNSTIDVEQIRKWWTKTPNANIGIPTGEKSDWLVLMWTMVVMKPYLHLRQHMENFRIWLLLLQEVEVGTMYLYTLKAGVFYKTKFAPGLDTRSTGGLIVVAPSIHVSGNRYEWIKDYSPFDRTPAEAPEWLLMLMEAKNLCLRPLIIRIERAAVFLQQLMKAAAIAP